MPLHALVLTNYRALARARVTFDDTTVLIGENDSGKAALLDALALALDPAAGAEPPRFLPQHFHRPAPGADAPAAGPIRVQLWFRERQAGDWDRLAGSPLAMLLSPVDRRPREIGLDLRASPGSDGAPVTAEWTLRSGGQARPRVTRDPAALAQLRRLQPLVHLPPGALFAAPDNADGVARVTGLPPEAAERVARIEASQAALLSGRATDVQATLAEGFAAARDLLSFAARHLDDRHHGHREMVAEILGREAQLELRPRDQPGETSAERIGVLALLAAILRVIPAAIPPGAEPLCVLEDPEAHLHPSTLAVVLGLLGRLRWQKILSTQSGDVLATQRLASLRRLSRRGGELRTWRVSPRALSAQDLRRVGYHLRARRGVVMFARCWLLVEGETEFWVLPELARAAGHDFASEGVACVEFAQCGLPALLKLARELGIEWHLLADGDRAGETYAADARHFLRGEPETDRITLLADQDIEHCCYHHGYGALYRRWAGTTDGAEAATQVIGRAIDRHSKPMLALELVMEAGKRGPAGVPAPLASAIASCIRLARRTSAG